MEANPPAVSSRRFGDLKSRVVSSIAAAAVGLTLVYLGGFWVMGLIALVTGVMVWEFRSVTLHRGGGCGFDVAYLLGGAVGAVVLAHFVSFPVAFMWLMGALIAGAVADMVTGRREAMRWGVLGGTYLGVAGLGFLYLRAMEPHGFNTALWIFLVVAAADVGGYFSGRLIGGAKLWPSISPKKTWSGAVGGVALAVVVGGLFSWASTGTFFVQVGIVSAAAAILSQGGDLAESALKRHFGVKDSGRVLPGHGGALDRFDGLVAAVLVVALVAWWRGQTVLVW